MEPQRFAWSGSDVPLAVWEMPDRRTAAQRSEKWILQAQVRAKPPPPPAPLQPMDMCAVGVPPQLSLSSL